MAARTAPARLLADVDGAGAPTFASRALAVLVETAARWPHVARRLLAPLLRERPQLAALLAGAALGRLAGIPEIDKDTLQAIEDALPADRHPDLDRHVVNVTEQGPEELRLPHDSRDPGARYDIVAVNQSRGAGFINRLANCRAGVRDAHPQWVGWTSRSFAQYVIAAENYSAGARAATINTHDQLAQRGKPSRQHVNSWLRDRH